MHNKKVFYVADNVSLQSRVGDIVHVKEFVDVLSKKGFQVTLLIRSSKTSQDIAIKNLTLVRIPSLRFPWSIFSYMISFVTIAFVMLATKPALIYVRDSGINVSVVPAKLLRIPVFLEINGDRTKEHSNLNKIFQTLVGNLTKTTYASANGIIIPSQNQISLLVPRGVKSEKIFNVPNGVNPNLFRPINKNLCRTKLVLQDAFYFCFVGHLALWQGIDNAIVSFSKLVRDNPAMNLRLMIVGDGPLLEKLKSLTSDLQLKGRVLFLGSIPHEIVPYAINACDVCIAPFTAWRNKTIGVSPLKLFEYLSCGKPVIASLIPGTEIIKELDAGILVEPDNVEDLKNAFRKAIEMLPYWEKKAYILHEELAKNHSWDSRVDDIVKIMHSVSNKSAL